MANRGRGRGKASMSINVEQLGFAKGEALPGPVLQPPPKYPPLDYKPLPFVFTSELNYLLEIKRDFAEFTKDSPHYVQPVVVHKDIERYSDWLQDFITDNSSYEKHYDWTILPAELRSVSRKRQATSSGANEPSTKKMKKDVDVETKLTELEKNENNQSGDVEDDEKADGAEDEEKETEEHVEEEEEEVDEEMDDGTDYVNNYFDNGEGFDDEDDNLDDGPVY